MSGASRGAGGCGRVCAVLNGQCRHCSMKEVYYIYVLMSNEMTCDEARRLMANCVSVLGVSSSRKVLFREHEVR